MSDDVDRLRRQLRFSVFLQAFAATMLGVAFVVRATTAGFDALTLAFGALMLIAAGAAVLIGRRAREL